MLFAKSYSIIHVSRPIIKSYNVMSFHIKSYHVMSYHMTHVISYTMSFHIMSCHISYHVISYHTCHIISYHVISYHVMYIISYQIYATQFILSVCAGLVNKVLHSSLQQQKNCMENIKDRLNHFLYIYVYCVSTLPHLLFGKIFK